METVQHTPIFYMDVKDFTTYNAATQDTILQRLQAIATEAARFFMPYGNPWGKWRRYGTGAGYYFVFDALSPQVALHYAVQFDAKLAEHNARHGDDLALKLYGVLVLGDVQLVGDQYRSEAFSEAARFLSYQPLKDYLSHQERPMVLAMSGLFHTEWREEIARTNDFPESASLQWTPFALRDQHPHSPQGYVRGPGWEQERPRQDTEADRQYYQACAQRWSAQRYALDKRFVQLTLLLDQGEEAQGQRWQSGSTTFRDLHEVLAHVEERAIVVLGPPGSGKSTLLRHFELDTARAALREDDCSSTPLTLCVSLNEYRPVHDSLPDPVTWLEEQWSSRFPDLPQRPPLETLLRQRQVTLLLDALNEIPVAGHAPVQQWRTCVRELARRYPRTRVIFSCRSLDYSASLSSRDFPVPQVRIEALTDAQVEEFVRLYCPEYGDMLWQNLRGTPQLDILRSPYYLTLLVAQTTIGEIPAGRAALFTGFVRQALRREMEGEHPLLQADTLLHERDKTRLVQRSGWAPFALPRRGPLIAQLSALAFRMQMRRGASDAAQVRVAYEEALAWLDPTHAEAILKMGADLAVLEHDLGRDEVLYVHQLLQEYFAARYLAHQPQPALARQAWQVTQIHPGLDETLATLADADPLPSLPATGWEETMVLAVAMAEHPETVLMELMEHNLALAGRCAAQPEAQISEALQDQVRWALVQRTQDQAADLRARIAAGLALGELGDPRFTRHQGPYGLYLLPPMIEVPAGPYRIGSEEGLYADEAPVHEIALEAFAMAQFPVTNAEWALFMQAGGYEDERWWETEAARAWRRGEGTAEGPKQQWREDRQYIQDNLSTIRQWPQEGRATSQQVEDWESYTRMTDEEFEALLEEWYPPGRQTQPAVWNDTAFNNPAQPVVGIGWFEARAYCAWLRAQSGTSFRLPTEVEWEAAARGQQGRRYAFGSDFDASRCNTFETHIRRTTPIGVFPGGVTPEGVVDLSGNVWEWTSSQYQPYPYDATDNRENDEDNMARRVLRGGSWNFTRDYARARSQQQRAWQPQQQYRAAAGAVVPHRSPPFNGAGGLCLLRAWPLALPLRTPLPVLAADYGLRPEAKG